SLRPAELDQLNRLGKPHHQPGRRRIARIYQRDLSSFLRTFLPGVGITMKRRWTGGLVTSCLLALVCASRADVVLDWNALMLDAIRADNSGPTISTRNLALLHTAIYDAVNSITRTHQPYYFQLDAPTNSSPEAAAVAAAYEITIALYPSFEPWANDLYDT